MNPGRASDDVANILLPAKKLPDSVPDSAPTKTDIATRAIRSNWGIMANPQVKAAVAALTCHYEYLDPLAGDIQVLGNNLYFSFSCFLKELHNKVPLNCRRWIKRHARPEEYEELGLERWKKNPPENRNGFVGHGSRLWLIQLQVRPWKYGSIQKIGETELSLAEPMGFEEHWWFTVSESWGEASDVNCDLTVAAGGSKLKADSRVLDAMAIKRGEDEILRENFSLTIRGQRSPTEVREAIGLVTFQNGDAELAPPADPNAEPRGFSDTVTGDTKRRDIEAAARKYAEESNIPPRLIDEVVAQAIESDDWQIIIDQAAERLKATAAEGDAPFAPGESIAEGTMTPVVGDAAPPPPKRERRSRRQTPPPSSDPLAEAAEGTSPTASDSAGEGGTVPEGTVGEGSAPPDPTY